MSLHRLRRLQRSRAFYSILALDHGLTFGCSPEAVSLPIGHLVESCGDLLCGVVLNYGLARALPSWPVSTSLILQCFGGLQGNSRRQTATVQQAVVLDAAAVSVQLDWSDPDIGTRMREVSAFTGDAHSAGFPVLYMINGICRIADLPKVIRVCQELGADLLKVNCSIDRYLADDLTIIDTLRNGPPVLMAGGSVSSNIFELAQNAAQIGFSGYCVGRNIFRADNPTNVANQLNTIFQLNKP